MNRSTWLLLRFVVCSCWAVYWAQVLAYRAGRDLGRWAARPTIPPPRPMEERDLRPRRRVTAEDVAKAFQ
jgi:hypothetical protein